MALLDVVARDGGRESLVGKSADEIKGVLSKIDGEHPLRGILETLVNSGENAAEDFQNRLADWFDPLGKVANLKGAGRNAGRVTKNAAISTT